MPLFTPNYALPYPAATDEPCDFAEQWCAFSDAFQAVLDGFVETAQRTIPAVPVARLLLSTPTVFTLGQEIRFDTLSVDTAGWVDFDADPAGITSQRGGYLYAVGNAQVPTSGVALREYWIDISNVTDQDGTNDNGVAGTVMGLNTAGVVTPAGPTRYALTINSTVTGTVTVNSAALAVFWHSDRATP